MKNYYFVLLALTACAASGTEKEKNKIAETTYVCTPCGNDCDNEKFTGTGTCQHCNMPLVDKNTVVHKNIQPAGMCSLDEKKVIFLDVRTPAEFNGTANDKFGAIKNAINIPVQELESRMSELEKYKDSEIVVYCSHSHRSPRASYMLTQKGFKHVTNMLGGMSVWKDEVKDKQCNDKFYVKQ
jgi:rhodanese-related sulfurtransferase/DNA-directed RNA polymerase subunit RPC12/RpoP